MYFVVPEEVPELTGKKGIVPGHVQSLRIGKLSFQKSRQKSSYFRRGTRRWYSSTEVMEEKLCIFPKVVEEALEMSPRS